MSNEHHKDKKGLLVQLCSLDEVVESLQQTSLVPDILTVHPSLALNFLFQAASQRELDLLVMANAVGIATNIHEGTMKMQGMIPFGEGYANFIVDQRDNMGHYPIHLGYEAGEIIDSGEFFLTSLKTDFQSPTAAKVSMLLEGDISMGILPTYGMTKFHLNNVPIYIDEWNLERERKDSTSKVTTLTTFSQRRFFDPSINQEISRTINATQKLGTFIVLEPFRENMHLRIKSNLVKIVDDITLHPASIDAYYRFSEDGASLELQTRTFTYSESAHDAIAEAPDPHLLETLVSEAYQIPKTLNYLDVLNHFGCGEPLLPHLWNNYSAFDTF